MQGFFYALILY